MRTSLLVFLLLVCSSLAFATANNCGTPAGSDPTYANPSASITLAAAEGCQTIDKIFTDWAVSSSSVNPPSGTTSSTADPADTTAVSVLGTLLSGTVTSPDTIRIMLSSADWASFNPDNGGTPNFVLTSVIDFIVSIDTSSFPSGKTYGIRGGLTYSGIDGGDAISISNDICYGGSPSPCTSGIDQTLNFSAATLTSGTPSGFVNISPGQTTLAIRSTIILTDDSSDGLSLTNYYLDFQEVPEPSSFLLLGSVLAGLVFFLRRRRHVS